MAALQEGPAQERICRISWLLVEGAAGIVFPPHRAEGNSALSLACGNAFLSNYRKVLPYHYFLYVCVYNKHKIPWESTC